MTQSTPDIPQVPTSVQVLVRFGLRFVILASFAAFSAHGFGRSLASILALAAVFCAVTAVLRREPLLGSVLTHWDEAAADALVSHLLMRMV